MADLLPDTDLIPASDVEALLELIQDRMPDATCAIIGKIFMIVPPELFGEPPRPKKTIRCIPAFTYSHRSVDKARSGSKPAQSSG